MFVRSFYWRCIFDWHIEVQFYEMMITYIFMMYWTLSPCSILFLKKNNFLFFFVILTKLCLFQDISAAFQTSGMELYYKIPPFKENYF